MSHEIPRIHGVIGGHQSVVTSNDEATTSPKAHAAGPYRRYRETRCRTASGDMTDWVRIEGVIRELYDVAFVPGVRAAAAIGFKTDEVNRVISIEGEP